MGTGWQRGVPGGRGGPEERGPGSCHRLKSSPLPPGHGEPLLRHEPVKKLCFTDGAGVVGIASKIPEGSERLFDDSN